jgi:hypothetical protein
VKNKIFTMAAEFHFEKNIPFSPENADEVLRSIPALPGVFALYGKQEGSEPYLTRAADIRRRLRRLLAPPESQSKRLNLRDRVVRIEYTITGSEFESTLTLYHASATVFGHAEARRRLRLHTPAFLRIAMENEFPRVYVTNRLSKRGLSETYGPFPSRTAAERYCDAVLDLFKLRRCHEDLHPYPEHPGCVYGEMKKCLEPCKQACTSGQYAAEAEAVKAFFETHGESMLSRIAEQREKASEEMEFERAAELHEQHQKAKSAASLADEIVQPLPKLRAIVVQRAASMEEREDQAALFLLVAGCIVGPERLSTLGVRAVKEQTSVGSSLFAQPLMLSPVPLDEDAAATETTNSPEDRARTALSTLEEQVARNHDLASLSDHLSLFRRWYFRPEKQRVGEAFLPNPDGAWPVRRILNGAARQVLGTPKALPEGQREAAKKMRVLHKGRPEVEREVPIVDRNE